MLGLFVVESSNAAVIAATLFVDALYSLMTGSGNLKVDRLDGVGIVEPVILLIPVP